jgi:macrolide-specific efflux system membrane fusion protein
MSGRQGMPNREELAAPIGRGGGEITPEMRQRLEQMRAGGEGFGGRGAGRGGGRGLAAGGPPGSAGFAGGEGEGEGEVAAPMPSIAAAMALNQPRNATVQLVLADGTRETREVVVGATDRVNAEIISGLVEGDRVLAGVIEARIEEEEEQNNNNNNQWRGGGPFPGGGGGGGFRPF